MEQILQKSAKGEEKLWKNAPTGANFAENELHVAKFIPAFCPTFSPGPPSKLCIRPCHPQDFLHKLPLITKLRLVSHLFL